MTWVSVPAGPPVGVGLALTPSSSMNASTRLLELDPLVEYAIVLLALMSLMLCSGDADARAKIGAAGNDGLQGLACALRADILEHEVVPLEDARVLTERGRLVLPIVDLPDRDLELILRARRRGVEAGEHDQRKSEAAAQRIPRSVRSHQVSSSFRI